ncbi:MAG: DUF839 domain-containing protein [Campylobacterales bacterium]|nr:DUF839 domain-containing protein [Campylobacterales bacterium]
MSKGWLSFAAVAALAVGFSGCDDSDSSSKGVKATKIEFIGMEAPKTQADMARSYSEAKVRVYTTDTSYTEYALEYNKLFGVKDKVGSNPHAAGQLYHHDMTPIMDPMGQPVIAETPDANSLLKVEGKLFLVSHLEYDNILSDGTAAYKKEGWYSRMPMNMLLTDIEQDAANGKLTAKDQKPIDHSSVHGGWIFCFGSQTPWNTHLGGEEDYDLYFTAASGAVSATTAAGLKAMSEVYFKGSKTANMYHYGYPQEVVVKKDGSYEVHKRYAMGKGTWEMPMVFGDKKTAMYGDDGTNVLMAMFVADKESDLSAGTLYAAKWNQTSASGATDGGAATLTWIKLGHATQAEVEGWANQYTFEDIFDYVTPADVTNGTSTAGYTAIKAGHTGVEYLKLKSGMETVAAFLEPRRLAALKGATTEFNKMEGVAINNKDKIAYMAMSYIDKGMKKDDSFPVDHIQIAKNNCGGTYEIKLEGGQSDTDGNAINSEYVPVSMHVPAALLGQEIAADANGNTCHVDKVANTDNVAYSEKMRTLFIGEDSGTHVNNYVWAYNIDSQKLSRIASVTVGGESTGLQVVDNMDGHAYIMSNSQHHGDYLKTMPADLVTSLKTVVDPFDANFGYIGGMPGLK